MADTVFQIGYFKKGCIVAKKWSFIMPKIIKLPAYVWKYIFKFTFKASYFLKFEILIRLVLKNFWRFILTNQHLIYKAILLVACSFLVVYLFPKGAKFKYEFQKGKPWQYASLYAPFDFSILKSPAELETEKQAILDSQFPYYRADATVYEAVKKSYASQFSNFFNLPVSSKEHQDLYDFGLTLLDQIYRNGVLPPGFVQKAGESVFLIKGNVESTVEKDQFVTIEALQQSVDQFLKKTAYPNYSTPYYKLFFEIVQPNIALDEKFTSNALDESLSAISPYRGLIQENSIIIKQGEVVEGEKLQMLISLRDEYASQLWNELSYYWIIFGYTILVVLTFMSLILFINNYRPSIFEDNREISFIFLNMVGMIALTTIVVNFDVRFLYAVPICILPLILKTFLLQAH